MNTIGKLEKVDIKAVWKTDDLLAETLGIPVQGLTREQSAEDFFVDLAGEDGARAKVIVENQFGEYRTRRLVLEAWEQLHRECLMANALMARCRGLRRGPAAEDSTRATAPTTAPYQADYDKL